MRRPGRTKSMFFPMFILFLLFCDVLSGERCVTSHILNVRTSPSTSSPINRSAYVGEKLYTTSTTVVAEGIKWIQLEDSKWVAFSYTRECSFQQTVPRLRVYCCNADNVNVRNGSSLSSPIVSTLNFYENVTWTGKEAKNDKITWWEILGGGKWVSKDYLEDCGDPTHHFDKGGLTVDNLVDCMPKLEARKAKQHIAYYNEAMYGADIITCARVSAFTAQVGHESGSLIWFEEIASGEAYEGRTDLGNFKKGDGPLFKGRGPIQLTGRFNYDNSGKDLELDLISNPWQVSSKTVGYKSTAWYWTKTDLNPVADEYTQEAFDVITKRINGGYHGKEDRDARWAICKKVLDCDSDPSRILFDQ